MICILSASTSNLGAILSSSFVIEPRMGALEAAMGAGEGGTEAMQRLVHAAPTCLPAAGKRAIAGRKRVIIIGGGCTLHAKTQYRAETNRVIKLLSLPRDRGRSSNETPDSGHYILSAPPA
jgi:hypothetical protein